MQVINEQERDIAELREQQAPTRRAVVPALAEPPAVSAQVLARHTYQGIGSRLDVLLGQLRGALEIRRTLAPNRTVRSVVTSPERSPFKPPALQASSNALIRRASDIRTKTGVVRLRQRNTGEKDGKRPKMGFAAGARCSDK
jgi:hypothetical protein